MLPSSAEMKLVRDRAGGTIFSGDAARPRLAAPEGTFLRFSISD